MNKTITIIMVDRDSASRVPCEADVVDGFAIHIDPAHGEGWTVTHVGSGLACGPIVATKRKAEERRRLFRQLSVDGVRFADMDAATAIQHFPEMYRQHLALQGKELTDDDWQEAQARVERIVRLMVDAGLLAIEANHVPA